MKQIIYVMVTFFLIYQPAQAQDTTDTGNNVVVVSYFKCYSGGLDKVDQMTEQKFAPILNDLVEEDKLVDWGTLNHYWGDEWNYILYYIAEDLGSFEAAFSEYFARGMENNPNILDDLDQLCPEHKDNIYQQGLSYQSTGGDN